VTSLIRLVTAERMAGAIEDNADTAEAAEDILSSLS
jgi:hypothetical protein